MAVVTHGYTGATAGATDGTLISEGTGLAPITGQAMAGKDCTPVRVAVRMVGTPLPTVTTVTISAEGTTADKWTFAKEVTANVVPTVFTAPLAIPIALADKNMMIYAKRSVGADEEGGVDTSVKIKVVCS